MSTLVLDEQKTQRRLHEDLDEKFDFSPWTDLPPVSPPRSRIARAINAGVGVGERVAALLLIILSAPVLAAIALAIKIESPKGTILYRQERVGLDRRRSATTMQSQGGGERRTASSAGQLFLIYKFRTMIPNAELSTGPVWATERDPRVTRLGHILRRLRLDELPQLFNIVKGQMRLIGPRPERPHFVSQLMLQIPNYASRQQVPPGITGLAQVERHYDASVRDVSKKVEYDLFYANNRCWLLDLKIMVKTVDVMLRGRGAR